MRTFKCTGRIGESLFPSFQGVIEPIRHDLDLSAIGFDKTWKVLTQTGNDIVAVMKGRIGILEVQQQPVLETRDAHERV